MSSPAKLLLLGSLGLLLGSCGGSGSRTPSARLSTARGAAATLPSTTAPEPAYLNDGDAEKVNDHDPDNKGNDNEDGDGDSVEEYETSDGNGRYHDPDDGTILTDGRAASASEARAVAALVTRYYAAAASGDGAEACSMISVSLAKAVPEDNGGSAGPSYLRGVKSCHAILTLLFAHFHHRLAGRVYVTGVRAVAGQALALLGSSTMAASYILLERAGATWKVDALLADPLP